MDSSFFLISNTQASTNSSSSINDLEQSSSSSSSMFNYDPFDGFSILDQQGLRLYDYFGAGPCGAGHQAHSPLISHQACPLLDNLDTLHNHHHHHHSQQPQTMIAKNFSHFPFQTDPTSPEDNDEDEDDLQGALTSFVNDIGGVDSDAGYTSGVDLFSHNTIADCSDSTEAYYLRLSLEQNCGNSNSSPELTSSNNYSDINNNSNNIGINNNSMNNHYSNFSAPNVVGSNGDSNTSQTTMKTSTTTTTTTTATSMTTAAAAVAAAAATKRSVLMNLLIDGSDVGAGYTSHNCRALPQVTRRQHV